MDSHERLNAALLIRNLQCDHPLIEKTIKLLKASYEHVPNRYPGDQIIYELYLFCLENGADMDKATKLIGHLIQRTKALMEHAHECGMCHIPQYVIDRHLICP